MLTFSSNILLIYQYDCGLCPLIFCRANWDQLSIQKSVKLINIIVIQSLSCVQLFGTPQTAACQDSLSFTISWSLFRLMSTEFMMPSSHLILYCPLLLMPSIFPSIRVFSNEMAFTSSSQSIELQLQHHYNKDIVFFQPHQKVAMEAEFHIDYPRDRCVFLLHLNQKLEVCE